MSAKPEEYPQLQLERQLCFPLYAASRLITRLYQPLLEPLDLTYPQYIVLLVLWADAPCPVSHLTERTLLNTNTLTPLLKRMELGGLIARHRCKTDERSVLITLTAKGAALRERCAGIPQALAARSGLGVQKALALKAQLDALVEDLRAISSPA